jgi:transcription elongation factor GreA
MAEQVTYLTPEGYKKMKEEIEYLQNVERPKISKMIAEARDKGDLSENAEYDAAKDAQGMLEARIATMQETFRNARVMDESKVDTSKVQILSKVKIKNPKNGAEVIYMLVAESEADVKAGKISINSPIAQGLLGKKVGDSVSIKVPSGMMEFNIVDILK